MIIHDLVCDRCSKPIRNYVFASSAAVDSPVGCLCGGVLRITYGPSYGRAFAGQWNGLARDKIVVFEHPDGRVNYPGRTDRPMPQRYADQGFVRRELAPWEVTSFEKKNKVTCEALHWNSSGMNAPAEDTPPPSLESQIKYSNLLD